MFVYQSVSTDSSEHSVDDCDVSAEQCDVRFEDAVMHIVESIEESVRSPETSVVHLLGALRSYSYGDESDYSSPTRSLYSM